MSNSRLAALSCCFFAFGPDAAACTGHVGPSHKPVALSPPRDLARWHDPEFATSVWHQLQGILARPVRISHDDRGRTVYTLLDRIVLVRLRDGRFRAYEWVCPVLGQPQLVHLNERQVAAQDAPWRAVWVEGFADMVALRRLESQRHLDPDGVKRYASWLLRRYAERINKSPEVRAARAAIQAALRPDRQTLLVANHFPRSRCGLGKATLADYNAAVRHQRHLARLRLDAPNLLGAYGILCQHARFPTRGEPLERLKHFLASQGVSRTGWMIVLTAPARLWLLADTFYPRINTDAVLDLIRCMDLLGHLPSATVLQAILSRFGGPAQRYESYARVVQPYAAILRHVTRLARIKTLEDEADLDLVVEWLVTQKVAHLTRAQRQQGWSWLVKTASAWHRARLQELELREIRWPASLPRAAIAHLQFVPICSGMELWEEGRWLRHCALDYLKRCASQEVTLLSIRAGAQRVATAELTLDEEGRWHVRQVRGKANTDVTPATLRCLETFLRGVNAAHMRLRAELPEFTHKP